MTGPAAVLFDLGGVLLPFDRERRVRTMVAQLGVTADAVRDLMAGDLPARIDRGEGDEHDLARALSRLCGRTVGAAEACALALSVFEEPNHEAWAMVAQIARKTLVGGFSDNPSFVRRMIPAGARLEPLFLSCELRAAKPSPDAFAAVEAALRRSGSAIVFVDDTPANIEAAATRGWDAILFQSNTGLRQDLEARGLL